MPTVNAKMWYSGRAQTLVGCSPAGILAMTGWFQTSDCSTLAITLRCSSTAPLETPVVPPVYCSTATSSALIVGLLERGLGALGDGCVEAHGAGQVVGRHHLLDVAHHVVDQRALEQAQLVAHGAQHHVLDRRVRDALLQRGGEVLDDDDGLGAGVLELVLQLARRVQRVDVDHHQAGAQDAGHGHRVLRHVGHHDGDAVALGQAQALQIGGEGAAQAVGLGVGDVLAHEAVGRAAGVLLEALFHQRHQR